MESAQIELDGQDGQKFTHAMGKPRELFFSRINEQNPSNVPRTRFRVSLAFSLEAPCSLFSLTHISSKRRLGYTLQTTCQRYFSKTS